jgi:hypothetical protein
LGDVGAPAGVAGGFVEAGDEALFAEDVEPLSLDGRGSVGAAGVVGGGGEVLALLILHVFSASVASSHPPAAGVP